jgi:hypothetical protein
MKKSDLKKRWEKILNKKLDDYEFELIKEKIYEFFNLLFENC